MSGPSGARPLTPQLLSVLAGELRLVGTAELPVDRPPLCAKLSSSSSHFPYQCGDVCLYHISHSNGNSRLVAFASY